MHEHIERALKREKGLNAEATYRKRKSCLKRFDGWLEGRGLEPQSASSQVCEEFILELKSEGYAPNTLENYYNSLSTFYGYLTDFLEVTDENPMEALEREKYLSNNTRKHANDDPTYVTVEEKEKMCQNVPAPKVRNELVIRLAFQTGLRRGELSNIKLEDIDRDRRAITDVYQPKTDDVRTVFYQPSLDFLLDQYLDHGHRASFPPARDSEYLFVTRQSEQLSGRRIREIVKQAAKDAGVQETLYVDQRGNKQHKIGTHELRHGYAVNALKCGVDLRSVQKQLGHASIEQTQEYLQLIDDDVREAHRRFNPEGPDDD